MVFFTHINKMDYYLVVCSEASIAKVIKKDDSELCILFIFKKRIKKERRR